jgi:hypothetical protein
MLIPKGVAGKTGDGDKKMMTWRFILLSPRDGAEYGAPEGRTARLPIDYYTSAALSRQGPPIRKMKIRDCPAPVSILRKHSHSGCGYKLRRLDTFDGESVA